MSRTALSPAGRPWRPLLPLLVALTGCGGGNGGGSSSSPAPAPAPAPVLSASAVTAAGLTATLAEDNSTIAVGSGVTYTLTLTNNTARAITIQAFLNGPGDPLGAPGNLQIVDSAGRTVYPIIAGTTLGGPPAPQQQADTLAPGQSISTPTPVPALYLSRAGTYSATATFSTGHSTPLNVTTVGPLVLTVQQPT